MPSIKKKGNIELEAQNAAISSTTAEEPRPDDKKSVRPAVLKRSAYSETEVNVRLETGNKAASENDGLLKHYSESNIHLQKLSVPYDDLKVSETSSGSGLAVDPFADGRALVSVDSGKDLVPIHDEIAIEDNVEKDKMDFEGKDTVIALPEGWPQFQNRPWRRRSCELVKSTSSCIRKAVSHLHQLQDLLDTFQKGDVPDDGRFRKQRSSVTSDLEIKSMDETQFQTSIPENRSLTDESGMQMSLATSHDRRIRWLLSSASLPNIDDEADSTEPRLQSSASGATLEVRGRSAVTFRGAMSSTKSGSASSLNVGQGDDVIDEVILLLGRMESDRISTLEALVKERERVQLLRSQIDTQAYKRMHDLPLAVQREHEACAIDINELRWHCAYRGRIEARIKERVHQAEVRHAKVLQDLSNIQKHCPLVEEKLDLEGEAMSSIQLKQDETDDELTDTIQRLRATETKTAEAQGRAAQERSLIKQDVAVVRNELNAVSDELAQLRMYFTSNTHTMNDIRNTLKENTQQLVVLEEREERIKALEAAQQDKVQSLRDKIVEQEAEHIKLVDENNKLRNEKQIAEVSMESYNKKLEHQIKNASKNVRGLTSKNKESTLEITDFSKKLEKCAKQKISDEKAVKRALQEMEKVKEQTEVSKEETRKVQVLHNNLLQTLVSKREEVTSTEESLKTTADALKKQVKDEAHARTVLQARIASDAQDFSKTQVDSKKKREKASQRAEEIEKLVENVREQVSKLEKIHKERLETIAQLNKILEKVALQHSEMEARFRSEIAELQPKEEELKKETLELSKRLDHITWKSEMMEKKMVDMESSTQMMNKVIRNTQQSYSDLNEEMTELKIQIETGFDTQQDLKKSLQQLEERIRTGESNHKAHMAGRSLVLSTNQSGVRTALQENQKLALTYHRLHNTFINNKAALMRLLEKRVNNEDSVKDHRQLHVLQGRMREALEYFYRLRGLQCKADIAEFELKCVANGEKLVALRSEMMRVVEHINRFLEANNASHDVISVEAAKIAQAPPSGALYA